jgi:hypothetical protein
MNEANNIGAALLQDASNTTGAALTGHSAAGQSRVAINFEHLLLNAPVIHSRYLGAFQGVIVAEVAIFSLGEFVFNYDDVFADPSVPILPSLPIDVLCAGDPAACVVIAPSPSPSPSALPSPSPTPTPSPTPSPSPTVIPSPSPSPSVPPCSGPFCGIGSGAT